MRVGYRCKDVPLVGMGQRIDDLLYERNTTAKDVAEAIGIDKKTMYAIMEKGECRLANIVKIANYFGVSLDWIVYGRGNGKTFNTERD